MESGYQKRKCRNCFCRVKAQEAKESFFPIPVYVRAAVTTTSVKQINENLYRIDINCQRPADGAVEIVFDTPSQGLYYSAGAGEHISVEVPNNLKNDPGNGTFKRLYIPKQWI